jgi:DNA-binding beta-propeller fold protein YncE
VGRDAVWVTGFHTLTRVARGSERIVATIHLRGVGDYSSVAVGAGSVWVTASEQGFRGLYRIDPADNGIVGRILLPSNPIGVAVGAGSVWVTTNRSGPGRVYRIDAHTGQILGRPIPVGQGPGPILFAAGDVWVTNSNAGGSVSRIDPHTGSVVDTWGASNVQAYGDGSLWGVTTNHVVRYDVDSGRVVAQIPMPRAAAVAYSSGRVWVITEPRSKSRTLYVPDLRHPGQVVTIDPQTNEVSSKPMPYGQTPAYIDARGNIAWIDQYNNNSLSRWTLTP